MLKQLQCVPMTGKRSVQDPKGAVRGSMTAQHLAGWQVEAAAVNSTPDQSLSCLQADAGAQVAWGRASGGQGSHRTSKAA